MQMRADELFRELVRREDLVERAKAEGKPVPRFPSLVRPGAGAVYAAVAAVPQSATVTPPSGSTTGQRQTDDEWERIAREELGKLHKTELDRVPEAERQVALEAYVEERRVKRKMAVKLDNLWEEQAKGRAERDAQGKASPGDKFIAWWHGEK